VSEEACTISYVPSARLKNSKMTRMKFVKSDWKFVKLVLFTLVVILCIAWYPLAAYGNDEIIKAVIISAILATANVLAGFAAIEYSIGKSTSAFLKYVIGGIGIRIFLMAGLLILLVKVYRYDVPALIISLAFFYFVFLMIEIIFINNKIDARQKN
jgi:hypothetical protein